MVANLETDEAASTSWSTTAEMALVEAGSSCFSIGVDFYKPRQQEGKWTCMHTR